MSLRSKLGLVALLGGAAAGTIKATNEPYQFTEQARAQADSLWDRSYAGKHEIIACMVGKNEGKKTTIEAVEIYPMQRANEYSAVALGGIPCRGNDYSGVVHTHILRQPDGHNVPHFSGPDSLMASVYNLHQGKTATNCVLYDKGKMYCDGAAGKRTIKW